jgi:hypothetical protein
MDLEQMANALMTPHQSSMQMLWMEPDSQPTQAQPRQAFQAPQEPQVRSGVASRGKRLPKAAPKSRPARRPRANAASRIPRTSLRQQASRKPSFLIENIEPEAARRSEELVPDARETAEGGKEMDRLMVAAGVAFDKIRADIDNSANYVKARFRFAMLRSLVMDKVKQAIETQTSQRVTVDDIANLVFEELATQNCELA